LVFYDLLDLLRLWDIAGRYEWLARDDLDPVYKHVGVVNRTWHVLCNLHIAINDVFDVMRPWR